MGSRSGFDADLELDELQNVIDRGSGAVPTTQRQANAQFNLGLIALAGGFSGGAPLQQVASEAYAIQTAGFTLGQVTTAQKAFGTSANGALTVVAGVNYGFEAQYLIQETGTTSHTVSVLFGGTATYSYLGFQLYGNAGATQLVSTAGVTGSVSVATAVVATPALAAAGFETIALYGAFKVNAGGTLIPQVQFSAAPGGTATMLAGSYFFVQPLSSNLVGQWS